MPSRKKDRGKQRKAAKQKSGEGRSAPVMQGRRSTETEHTMRELKESGCRVVRGDDGCNTIRHPFFRHIRGKSTVPNRRNFDRGLLNDEERQELAGNYVHNYAWDLREGDLHGMQVIVRNISDSHIGSKLVDELLKADIHLSFLHFLNQSNKTVSDVLGRTVTVGESIELPGLWVGILWKLIESKSWSDDLLLTVAKGMEPFAMAMIDDKRKLFRSNLSWHLIISQFFDLVPEIMKSKEAFLVMISYEGFLPLVAQASCWSQSREDIVAERELLRNRRVCDDMTTPGPIHTDCHHAQRVLSVVLQRHCDVLEETELRGALDQIARTPLLSNDPHCDDSTIVGLIRMMNEHSHELLLECIIEPLLLTHNYVDARVIAELIEYGRDNSYMEAAQTVLNTMVSILGRDEDLDEIQEIDSRYAAAIRHGLWEFCINALITYGDKSDCEIAEGLHCIASGLYNMAMHSKTSRALRKRKEEVISALQSLRKKSAPRFDTICTLIDGALDASDPATCCNCLQEIDRKKLLFCQRCNIECYCSPACQTESYALGHDNFCKEEVQFFDGLRGEGLNETELKRLAVLSNNLMMNGCRYVRSNIAEILDLSVEEDAEIKIDFGECPPHVEVSRNDAGKYSGSLKCTFYSPAYYGFVEKVDWDVSEDVFQDKTISRRHLG